MLSGGAQRIFLPWCQGEEMKLLRNNHSFPRVVIELTTVAFQSHPCAPAPRRHKKYINFIFKIRKIGWLYQPKYLISLPISLTTV